VSEARSETRRYERPGAITLLAAGAVVVAEAITLLAAGAVVVAEAFTLITVDSHDPVSQPTISTGRPRG